MSHRRPHGEDIRERMRPWLMEHTKQHIFEVCQANSAPTAPLFSVEDLYVNQHLEGRGYFVEVEHPSAGRLRVPGAPFQMGEGRWGIDRPAPLLGQHNEEVYCGLLGVSKDDLPDLRRAGVI